MRHAVIFRLLVIIRHLKNYIKNSKKVMYFSKISFWRYSPKVFFSKLKNSYHQFYLWTNLPNTLICFIAFIHKIRRHRAMDFLSQKKRSNFFFSLNFRNRPKKFTCDSLKFSFRQWQHSFLYQTFQYWDIIDIFIDCCQWRRILVLRVLKKRR